MGKLKPIGSEKLQGMDKIQRMIEISTYKLNTPQSINENSSLEFQKTLVDGNTYHIIKEKNGYVLKKGINESESEYIEPMKNRKYYSSYSQALKRLNLVVKEVSSIEGYDKNLSLFNESDDIKYFLKSEKTEQTQPEQQAPQPAPAPAPAPAPQEPAGEEELDMDFDMEEEPETEEPSDEKSTDDGEIVTYKTIQKLVGKLGQKTREFLSNDENELDTKQVKYIINSILSALPLESLDEEDKEEIMTKFEGGEEELSSDDEMSDETEMDMDFEDSEEVTPEPPMAPEKTEGYGMMYKTDKMKEMIENIFSESKVEKVLNKYFEPSKNQVKEKLQNLSESFQQQKSVMRFINENPETKIVGKNKQGEILMINNKKLISVNNKGRLI